MDNFMRIKEAHIRNKVRQIKKFYWFLLVVCFVSLGMLGMAYFLFHQKASSTVVWIFAIMPVVSLIILFMEYLRVFDVRLNFIKRWEEDQIKKIMEKSELELKNMDNGNG
jgi:cytochrome bd-type quinol oxidase subunit 2